MTATENLPALPPEPTIPGGDAPLRDTPTIALAYTLGWIAAKPVRPDQWGLVCSLVDELSQRWRERPGSSIPTTEFAVLMAALPRSQADGIQLLYSMQRGQRWAQTGRQPVRRSTMAVPESSFDTL
jgi:hypothetical protein